jgi:hypothetical protein
MNFKKEKTHFQRELLISKMIQNYQGLSFLLVTFIGLADLKDLEG